MKLGNTGLMAAFRALSGILNVSEEVEGRG